MSNIESVYSFDGRVVVLLDFFSGIQRCLQGLPLMLLSSFSCDCIFGFLPAIVTLDDGGFGMDYSNCLIV